MLAAVFGIGLLGWKLPARAAGMQIRSGVSVEGIDLSGMTQEEAEDAVEAYVEGIRSSVITLQSQSGEVLTVTAGELGLTWTNTGIIKEAVTLGHTGNIVEKYKVEQDLLHRGMNYEVELDFDQQLIGELMAKCAERFDVKAVNAKLRRENGAFSVETGQTGYIVDQQLSASAFYQYLTEQWHHQDEQLILAMTVEEPKGTAEELLKVKDLLGSFTTSYTSSGPSRSKNVANGASLVNGATVYPGETFSFYDAVKPFSEANGYYMAGSYLQGRVVDSLGGGICQVSTTLYNAVLKAELDVTERHNHSMIVNYVDPSADAAIAESAGKDLQFVNNLEYPIYIEGYTKDKKITFNIYGVETRPSNRTVTFESVVIEKKVPEADQIIADASQPVGYITVSSEHIGYKAELYKIVKENGVQVSRELVNKSNYAMSPRTAIVGTATSDPNVLAELNAAIATSNVNTIKQVLANIKAVQDALAALTPEERAAIAAAQQAAQDAAAGN